jgi:Zn-dependent protease
MKQNRMLAIQAGFFLLTIATTTIAGAEWMYGRWLFMDEDSLTWDEILSGLNFSIPFLLILTFHEFGHYIVARINNVKVTLPFYLPFWFGFIPGLPSFGTMGAFIRIKDVIVSRRVYFDIGVSGPIAGFVIAIGILWYGFSNLPEPEYIFQIHPDYEEYGLDYADHVYDENSLGYQLGDNVIFWFFKTYVADPTRLPHPNEITHYPFILAGYLALFFTALNLLPIGQLDGGHVIFGLFGEKISRRLNQVFYTIFLFYAGLGWASPDLLADTSTSSSFYYLGALVLYMYFLYICSASMLPKKQDRWFYAAIMLTSQYLIATFTDIQGYEGWLLFAFLIGRVLGVYHPKVVDNTPLDGNRQLIGWIAIIIFLLSFSPQPFVLG